MIHKHMLLYHGSKERIEIFQKAQAASPKADVPKEELLNAVYFTPDYGFAIACAARPKGKSKVDDENKVIEFEHPELFDPEKDIYIYTIESDSIPAEYLKLVKGNQLAYIGTADISPESIECKKSIEIAKYYKLENWAPIEKQIEISNEFNQKMR